MKEKLNLLNKIIAENQRFVLLSHIYTDGDALGSLLSFYYYLKEQGKEVQIFVPGKIPEKYNYLHGKRFINRLPLPAARKAIRQAQVLLIMDISALDRLADYYDAVMDSTACKVCIDHHPIRETGLELCIVDSKRIATAEIIYLYFLQQQVKISLPMAEALYTAILSDSGSFRFKGTGAFTLEMAARMAALGVDPAQIYTRIYEKASHQQLRAWGQLLAEMQSDGFFVWAVVSRKFLDEHQLTLEEIDGLIDIMRKDGRAGVFAVFVEKTPREILVGLRSRNGVDVGLLARSFGGGGHLNAAGFTAEKSLQEVISETRIALKKMQGMTNVKERTNSSEYFKT